MVKIDKDGKIKYEITEYKRGCSTCRSVREIEVESSDGVNNKPPINKESLFKAA